MPTASQRSGSKRLSPDALVKSGQVRCASRIHNSGIQAIVELKSRNPRFGCPRIARIISQTFGIDIDKNVVYRVLAKHYRPAPGGTGPSWLSFIGHTTDSLWSVDLFIRARGRMHRRPLTGGSSVLSPT